MHRHCSRTATTVLAAWTWPGAADRQTTVGWVSTLSGKPRFPDDDGSPDPQAAAALAAFATGGGSEHAALAALAGSRLLVPVVAVLAAEITSSGPGRAATGSADAGSAATGSADSRGEISGEKASEMAVPKLVGQDGRSAIPAFTCLDSLNQWRPGARPVPAEAAAVWHAAADDCCAVVIDVAGPVQLAVEGARLAAMARGDDAPLPQDDPDIRDAVTAAVTEQAPAAGFRLLAGEGSADLLIELDLPPAAAGGRAAQIAAQVGSAVMARLGSRLRRGIGVTLRPPST
jgi:hypothetical protein